MCIDLGKKEKLLKVEKLHKGSEKSRVQLSCPVLTIYITFNYITYIFNIMCALFILIMISKVRLFDKTRFLVDEMLISGQMFGPD